MIEQSDSILPLTRSLFRRCAAVHDRPGSRTCALTQYATLAKIVPGATLSVAQKQKQGDRGKATRSIESVPLFFFFYFFFFLDRA
jgi:hypothetical protein